MIRCFDEDTLPVTRWKNGGGETREIARFPPEGAEFDWRLSIATLACDGDFSRFPGIDRIITLLSGDSVALWQEGRLLHRLQRHQPFAFRGEQAIAARLSGAPGGDFNIMCRRASHRAAAGIASAPFSSPAGAAGVIWVLAGEWQHPQASFTAGQGAWWPADGGSFIPRSPDARLLWGTMTPLRHAL